MNKLSAIALAIWAAWGLSASAAETGEGFSGGSVSPETVSAAQLSVQLPLRTDSGALFFPESLADAGEHGAVVGAISDYLDLPSNASAEERSQGFSTVTNSALEWAHSMAGPIPKIKTKTQIADYLKEVQKRVLLVPGLTTFNELYDHSRGAGGGVTSFEYGQVAVKGRLDWARVHQPANRLSIVYGPKTPPLLHEAIRVHEFAHVADLSRFGIVDGQGKSITDMGDAQLGLLLELKAHALGFILHRAFYKKAAELKTALYSSAHVFEDIPEGPLFFAVFQEMMTYPAYAAFNPFHPARRPTRTLKPSTVKRPATQGSGITLIRTIHGPQDIR